MQHAANLRELERVVNGIPLGAEGMGSTSRAFGTYDAITPDLDWSSVDGFTVDLSKTLVADVSGIYAVTMRCRMFATPGTTVEIALSSGGGFYDRFSGITDGGGEYQDGLSAYMELSAGGAGFGPSFIQGASDCDGSTFDVTATLIAPT